MSVLEAVTLWLALIGWAGVLELVIRDRRASKTARKRLEILRHLREIL